jgi:hypothetical protein
MICYRKTQLKDVRPKCKIQQIMLDNIKLAW